jgi:hypothetical protein
MIPRLRFSGLEDLADRLTRRVGQLRLPARDHDGPWLSSWPQIAPASDDEALPALPIEEA